jgi:hypothetical protein
MEQEQYPELQEIKNLLNSGTKIQAGWGVPQPCSFEELLSQVSRNRHLKGLEPLSMQDLTPIALNNRQRL